MGNEATPEQLEQAARQLVTTARDLLRQDFPDSVSIGTDSKGGAVKVFFNADDPANGKRRVDAGLEVLAHLRTGHAALSGA